MSTPAPTRRHSFSVADFHRLGETGVLAPDSRVELIEGDLIDMAPTGSPHGGMVLYLNNLLVPALGGRALVGTQNPLALDEQTEVYPDVFVLKPRADWYRTAHPRPQDILLLIEVADSTILSDRRRKLPLYARHGIAEVWLIDLVQQVVEVCREPGPNGFAARSVHREGTITASQIDGVRIDLAGLF